MSIVRCIHCHEEVRVPERVSSQALVECPRCGQQFALNLALEKLPPLLVVIVDPGAVSDESQDSNESPAMAVPRFEFEERDAPAPFAVARPSSTSSMASRARRRESSSGTILSAIAVLGGGFCALPLAQLVLWWVFGQDPVDLGPSVSQYASFLVPEKFRATPTSDDSNDSWDAASASNDRSTTRTRPERVAAPPRNSDGNSGTNADSNSEDSNSDSSDAGSNESSTTNDSRTDADDQDSTTRLGPSPLENMPAPSEPRARPERLSDLPPATASEISALIGVTVLAQDDWLDADTFSDDERASRLDAFYQTYCDLSENLARYTPTDPENDSTLGSIDQALRFELEDQKLRTFLANRAEQVLSRDESVGEGIALVGTIVSIEEQAEFDVLVLRLGDGNGKVVRVASWLPLPTSIIADQTVAVFGRVDSAEHLGWDAEQTRGRVVLGGYLILLADASPR